MSTNAKDREIVERLDRQPGWWTCARDQDRAQALALAIAAAVREQAESDARGRYVATCNVIARRFEAQRDAEAALERTSQDHGVRAVARAAYYSNTAAMLAALECADTLAAPPPPPREGKGRDSDRVRVLRQALAKYGSHGRGCRMVDCGDPCTCGYWAALASTGEEAPAPAASRPSGEACEDKSVGSQYGSALGSSKQSWHCENGATCDGQHRTAIPSGDLTWRTGEPAQPTPARETREPRPGEIDAYMLACHQEAALDAQVAADLHQLQLGAALGDAHTEALARVAPQVAREARRGEGGEVAWRCLECLRDGCRHDAGQRCGEGGTVWPVGEPMHASRCECVGGSPCVRIPPTPPEPATMDIQKVTAPSEPATCETCGGNGVYLKQDQESGKTGWTPCPHPSCAPPVETRGEEAGPPCRNCSGAIEDHEVGSFLCAPPDVDGTHYEPQGDCLAPPSPAPAVEGEAVEPAIPDAVRDWVRDTDAPETVRLRTEVKRLTALFAIGPSVSASEDGTWLRFKGGGMDAVVSVASLLSKYPPLSIIAKTLRAWEVDARAALSPATPNGDGA